MVEMKLAGESDFVFDFEKLGTNVAIQFSGGMESTLLLYLFLKEWHQRNSDKKYCAYTFQRWNRPIEKAKRLIKIISEHNNWDINHEVLDMPIIKECAVEAKLTKSMILERGHDSILAGVQSFPDDESIRPKNIIIYPKDMGIVYAPFRYLQKHHTIDAYHQLNIEYILPHTHSCGSNLDDPCNICYNCRERIWGYEKLGMAPNMGC